MKCEKCGNDYNSQYYFATQTICRECFGRLTTEEQDNLRSQLFHYDNESKFQARIRFGKRFAAALIDALIYGAINIGVLYYSGYFKAIETMTTTITENPGDNEVAKMALNELLDSQKSTLILTQLIPILYFSLELFISASLGKLILGLVIGSDEQTKADMGSLVTRYLFKNISVLISLIGLLAGVSMLMFNISPFVMIIMLIGFFFILGKKRQAFHDMFSKTTVYKRSDIKVSENSI